jgi:hypothetical protein
MSAPPTPEMIKKIFEDIEDTRTKGIWLASKYVLEHRYDGCFWETHPKGKIGKFSSVSFDQSMIYCILI